MKERLVKYFVLVFPKHNIQYRKQPILHWSVYVKSCAKEQRTDEVIIYKGHNNTITLL